MISTALIAACNLKIYSKPKATFGWLFCFLAPTSINLPFALNR
jgi:hypothetical protein